ncbi:MAG: hypothetical protein HY298_12620 [Verrucomicrobia bacterium]|nr:hypothetical protein [Verrucomicrobiota bacterium]
MPDPAPNAELLRSLGQLVRGLSALFWGLPIALIVCVQTAKSDWLKTFGMVPPVLVTGWLLYGLWQLGYYQKQERIWRSALDRAKLFGLVNLGLSPFLYWSNKIPNHPFFMPMVALLALSGLIFLSNFNLVLQRLSAMLPDETLRLETRHFTTLNRCLLLAAALLALSYQTLVHFNSLPIQVAAVLEQLERQGRLWWLLLTVLPLAIFVLLPLAMTMALLWKIKETILDSVFGAENRTL